MIAPCRVCGETEPHAPHSLLMTNPAPTPHPPNDLAAPGDLVGEDGSIYMAAPAPQPFGPFRARSANCLAGDHEECAAMVEQDVAELGITDCLCDCHREPPP